MFDLFKKKKTIVAHDGSFHTDDVFAVAALDFAHGGRVRVIRTRDMALIAGADIVVDVGGEYDEARDRFDHHQIGGAGIRKNGIPYASFGLVWKKYGSALAGSDSAMERLDTLLVQPIDAIDNGVDIAKPLFEGVYNYGIHSVVSSFLPTWKEDTDNDVQFLKAVSLAKMLLSREIKKTKDYLEAAEYMVSRYHDSEDKGIIVVDKPIGRTQIIAALMEFPEPVYVVYPDKEAQRWSVAGMLREFGSFDMRKPLPASWAGERDAALQRITGVPDAVFCHTKRFLVVARSKQGALALAQKAFTS